LDTVYANLAQHDIGLIPVHLNTTFAMAKSGNRLATMLALGLATVASPVPSYLEGAQHGTHALFASTASEWRGCLQRISGDREFARAMARDGRDWSWNNFYREAIGRRFMDIIARKSDCVSNQGEPCESKA
jgi:hypothetical protein